MTHQFRSFATLRFNCALMAVPLVLAAGSAVGQGMDTADMSDVLRQSLAERDAVIAQLEARIARLEQQSVGTVAPVPPPPQPSPAPMTATATEATPPPTAPSEFEVDPETAERALERTLVTTGQLLLPPGKVDVEPSLSYQHIDSDDSFAVIFLDRDGDGIGEDAVAETRRSRRNEMVAGLEVRVGLPYDSQLELGMLYNYVDETIDQPLGGISDDSSGSGVGDFRLGFAKTLVREQGFLPDIVGRITWDSDVGRDSDGPVSLNSDFNEFAGSLNMLKRVDPLALTSRISYQRSLEQNDIQPGDVFGFGVGAALAASPSTSLSVGFNAAFRSESEIDGVSVDGSDENQASITFGISRVIGRNTLLRVNFGAGLTEDSPDYFVAASLPVRFSAW